jgi:hypothetical protein
MDEAKTCQGCDRFRGDRHFSTAEELKAWMVETGIGEEDGDLADLYMDEALDRPGPTFAFKCVSCGQVFAATITGSRQVKWTTVRRPPRN